ncbi:MAG: SPFH domain-containing protein [Patescibacteria group bacterium]
MDLTGLLPTIALVVGIIVVLLVAFFAISRATRLYHRVPPSQVLVVFGRGKTQFDADGKQEKTGVRFITGGGGVVLPILEECTTIDLTVMTITQNKDRVYSTDGVAVNLDWVAQVKIAEDQHSLATAARTFLGKSTNQIVQVITETLSTNFRAIVGQMTVEGVHRDRDAFVQAVQKLAADEMTAMGVRIISMGVKEITDDLGYFEAMAAPKIAEVMRDAKIAKSLADQAAREQEAKSMLTAREAELHTDEVIAQKERDVELQKVDKNKQVGLAQADADKEVQTKKALAVAQQQEAEVLVPARAAKEAVEINANAARSKTETEADANAYSKKTAAQAEAQAVTLTGQATADANKAKLFAEAEGTRANLLAEAEGKQKIAEATAAEGEVNLRQFIAAELIKAQQATGIAFAAAMGQIGENVRIVQIGDIPAEKNGLLGILQQAPLIAVQLNEQVKALTGGMSIEQVLTQVAGTLKLAGKTQADVKTPSSNEESAADISGKKGKKLTK